jgi:hypothetical protein
MAQIMTLFKIRYRVESARLPRYDYTSPGRYFITICTHNKACHFDDVVNGEMCLSPIGEIVADEWQNTPKVRSNVELELEAQDRMALRAIHFYASGCQTTYTASSSSTR